MAEHRVFEDQTNRPVVVRKSLPHLVTLSLAASKERAVVGLKERDFSQGLPQTNPSADLLFVSEYSAEIGDYFLVAERSYYRITSYMSNQPEITERMRMILIDWLVDVVIKFKLHAETYYLAVDLVDRYLGAKEVGRSKLQLLGITAVLLAAKHEEIWPPGIKDCVFICANTYTAQEVFTMERDIAVTLRFKLTVPTTYPLACRFLEGGDSDPIVRDATFFFLESASHNYEMLQYLPSRVAAAAIFLGRLIIAWNATVDKSSILISKLWDPGMTHISRGITLDEVICVASKLLSFTEGLCMPSSKLQAVRRKYLSPKYNKVGSLDLPTPLFLTSL